MTKNISRQFSIARKEQEKEGKDAPGGSLGTAGKIEVPAEVNDGVIWEDQESGKSYVRLPGNKTIMVFKVSLYNVLTLCQKSNI